jgi:hypothetical protein
MKKLESSEAYFKSEGTSSSTLKKIHQKTLLHALSIKTEQSPAMILGSAIHCAILDPERYDSDFLISPKFDKRTSAGKAAFADFERLSDGKTIIDEEMAEKIKGIKNSVLTHPIAKEMLSSGEAEYSYYSEDSETGLKTKCRPDYHNSDALIDLKTTLDASYEGFSRQIGNMGYHIQAAFYLDVFNKSQSLNYKDFYFIAVENTAPYAVAIYRLNSEQIEHGRIAYRSAIKQLSEYLKSGETSEERRAGISSFGYPCEIIDIQVPYYLLDKIKP